MHIVKVRIESAPGSPYSQGKGIDILEHPKKPKESPNDYEERTWRYRLHTTSGGQVEIPSTSFEQAIRSSARRLAIQVPGKGKTLFTKYFEAGISCASGLVLPVLAKDVPYDRLFVPSDGKPGGGKRVWKFFPRIDKWGGEMMFYVLDDIITEHVFAQVLRSAGLLVGIGRFRPENRGFYGRFKVASVDWIDDGDAVMAAAE